MHYTIKKVEESIFVIFFHKESVDDDVIYSLTNELSDLIENQSKVLLLFNLLKKSYLTSKQRQIIGKWIKFNLSEFKNSIIGEAYISDNKIHKLMVEGIHFF
ncbi:MAG: hypothetical protein U9N85_09350 [Bacteroidota bacterium]|nr:hypothetical protein [Bacteroidota bacterium]